MSAIDLSLVPSFYHGYINNVKTTNLNEAFREERKGIMGILSKLSEENWNYRYAEGKWSIKEMVQHLIDAERIFAYRALCIARGETASLPGFDENNYAAHSDSDRRSGKELFHELSIVHEGTALLFASFTPQMLQSKGIANGKTIYAEAIGFITVGHTLHHLKVLNERYM